MKQQEYCTFKELPPIVQMSESHLRRRYIVSWADGQFINDIGVRVYKVYSVECSGILEYGDLINRIVGARYTDADVTAIYLNNLNRDQVSDDKAQEYAEELSALQEWRAQAKLIAKNAIAFAQEQGWIS